MIFKRLFFVALAIMLLAACAFAEEYTPAAPAAEWKVEDFNGTWSVFYMVSDGVGSDTRESVFQRSLAIDGESAVNTFTYPEGESIVNCTIEYADENIILTYEDGSQAELMLLEDGTLQLHLEANEINPETTLYYEKVEP